MTTPRSFRCFSLTKSHGILTIVLLNFFVNLAASLVLDLSKDHSLISNTSLLNPSRSGPLNAGEKAVCTTRREWVGTGYLEDCCHRAFDRMYVNEVARYQNRMKEFIALGEPVHPSFSFPTPRKFTVGERSRLP